MDACMVDSTTDETRAPVAPARHRLTKVGRVVSDKMDKTVVVTVPNRRRHRIYHKIVTHTHRFKAHDERNECRIGDLVRIEESRPYSKEKTWVVRDIVERAERL